MNKTNDIVITVGTVAGSVLSLISGIRERVHCRVFALCSDMKTMNVIQASKFVTKAVLINGSSEFDYIQSIKRWYDQQVFHTKPVLYFTNDTSCYYVDNHRAWFEERFKLCLPSSKIIKHFTEKGLAEVKALEAGLNVPRSQVLLSKEDADIVVNEFSFPVIIKPRATYLENTVKFKTKILENPDEFLNFLDKVLTDNNTFLCQEFIKGGPESSFYYLFYRSEKGEIYENMGRKTLQAPPSGGIMAKGVVEYNAQLAKICQRFLNKIDYHGIGGIEFKYSNGKFYFIEMSVRLEGFFKIAEISRTPLSVISYLSITKQKSKLTTERLIQRNGYVYCDVLLTLKTRMKSKQYIMAIREFLSGIFFRKVKFNVFNLKDRKPFYVLLKNVVQR